MNFYKRYIGDYARDTAHLSLIEHGIYTVLLDTYYATEKPLPADKRTLYRIVKATTKSAQKKTTRVLDRFFPIAHDGLRHNKRADREISKWALIVKHNREVGAKGGRPKITQRVSENNPLQNQSTSIDPLDLNHLTVEPVDKSKRKAPKLQDLLNKKMPEKPKQSHDETERRREIGKALAAGDKERARLVRDGE
jgi:uncharacterized protein YdaU (DUF1376 family)